MRKKALGLELKCVNNSIRRHVEEIKRENNIDKLTGSNGWIIGYILDRHGEDVYQRDLEEQFGITRSTASRVIDLLVYKGMIERKSVPHDARLKKLVLTPKAVEFSNTMQKDRDMMETVLKKGFTDDEIEQLYAYLGRIQKNLDEMEGK